MLGQCKKMPTWHRQAAENDPLPVAIENRRVTVLRLRKMSRNPSTRC